MALNYTNYFRVISASSVCQTLASELIMGWSIHCADLTCWVLALLYSFLLLIYSGRRGRSNITYSLVLTHKRVKYCISMWRVYLNTLNWSEWGYTGFMRFKRMFRKQKKIRQWKHCWYFKFEIFLIHGNTLVNPEFLMSYSLIWYSIKRNYSVCFLQFGLIEIQLKDKLHPVT